jgi:hypothetical protein
MSNKQKMRRVRKLEANIIAEQELPKRIFFCDSSEIDKLDMTEAALCIEKVNLDLTLQLKAEQDVAKYLSQLGLAD